MFSNIILMRINRLHNSEFNPTDKKDIFLGKYTYIFSIF